MALDAVRLLLAGSLLSLACDSTKSPEESVRGDHTQPAQLPRPDSGSPEALASPILDASPIAPTREPPFLPLPDSLGPAPSAAAPNPAPSAQASQDFADAGPPVRIHVSLDSGAPGDVALDASHTSEPLPVVDAPLIPTPCEVEACNDHGWCIDRQTWTLCSCETEALPACELPLFREIGPSRTQSELILTTLSADGSTIVGSHVPWRADSSAKVGVKWTLVDGVQVLEQDPRGPTVPWSTSVDGRVIFGGIEVAGAEPIPVVWRDGSLEMPDPTDPPTNPLNSVPTVDEVADLLAELGMQVPWAIWVVNDISQDGKVIFGLGACPLQYGARWLLRLP
jgi:hypothetical protein